MLITGTGLLLTALSILIYSFNGVAMKVYTESFPSNSKFASSVYSVFLGVVVAVVTFIANGFSFSATWLTLLLGFINGFAIFFYNFFFSASSERGSFSVLSLFSLSGCIILPILVTSIAFLDAPTLIKLIGIAVMFVAFVLICVDFHERTENKKGFFPCCIGLALSNGAFGVFMALENRLEAGESGGAFVTTTYLTASVISLVFLTIRNKKETFAVFKLNKRSFICFLISALLITAGSNLTVVALSYVPEAFFYPAENGGVLILSAILSLLIFKEKIELQKWIGIIIAAASIVLLSI